MPAWIENGKSAQPCGCDEGANYRCEYHRALVGSASTQNTASIYSGDGTGSITMYQLTASTGLPDDPAERKKRPIATGVLDYFPKAIAEIAYVSWVGNEQHNPGTPLHWDRNKSADELDAMMRHYQERGTIDKDGTRHTAKMAWRALAYLEKELEGA